MCFQVPPVVDLPKPAALHLYPHIHSTKAMSGSADSSRISAAHLAAAGGSMSAAHYKSLLQPQLYNLHNSSLNTQSVKAQLEKVSDTSASHSVEYSHWSAAAVLTVSFTSS